MRLVVLRQLLQYLQVIMSIKNIGIIHNREFEDGVLRLEMYDRISLDAAVQLLRKHHYTIYER